MVQPPVLSSLTNSYPWELKEVYYPHQRENLASFDIMNMLSTQHTLKYFAKFLSFWVPLIIFGSDSEMPWMNLYVFIESFYWLLLFGLKLLMD